MKEKVFRIIIHFLKKHPSRLFAILEIQILYLLTARAFGKRGKCILFSKNALKEYARFTQACMKKPSDQKRLFIVSRRIGRIIRRLTGFKNMEDRKQLVFLLYQNIGITMDGDLPGTIYVSKCYFSKVYSVKQCKCISAMDAGIIAGICGDGTLTFIERITEGCEHCKAHFKRRNQ